ncbi:MAG: nucleoside triphosphate pyrophosphohydrolase, partial [Bacteroidetes bacterium]
SLVKAIRIQEKAKGIGFEWEHAEDVWNKVEEELGEVKMAIEKNDQNEIEEEFGDLLFSLVNYARFIKINPENALSRVNNKFVERFKLMEELMDSENVDISSSTLEVMDTYWERAKLVLKNR